MFLDVSIMDPHSPFSTRRLSENALSPQLCVILKNNARNLNYMAVLIF